MTKKRGGTDAVQHLSELIHDIKVAMMTTVEDDGSLRSRPMWTHEAKTFEGELWFFTRQHSHKVDELEHDHHVNLSYAEPKRDQYVSLSGRCSLVTDREKMEKLWTPALKAWFPEGLEDPELSLLRVSVEKAEYWDMPSSRMVQLAGLVKATVTGRPPEPGDNAKVNFHEDGTTSAPH
jgi:general stress protein 26